VFSVEYRVQDRKLVFSVEYTEYETNMASVKCCRVQFVFSVEYRVQGTELGFRTRMK